MIHRYLCQLTDANFTLGGTGETTGHKTFRMLVKIGGSMASLHDLDRTPVQSKKFIAFFLSSLLSRICLVMMIKYHTETVGLAMLILGSTCVDLGYILGQTALDIYVRGIAKMVGKSSAPE